MSPPRDDSPYSNGTGTKETIRAIENNLARHQDTIDDLYRKIDTIGKTNWQIVLSGIGVLIVVMGGLWGLTVSPVNSDVGRLTRDLTHVQNLAATRGVEMAAQTTQLKYLELGLTQSREYTRRVETERVSAQEFHTALSASLSQRETLQRQLDALNRKVDEVFPPQKTLEDLTRRLAELERTRSIFPPVVKP